MALTSAYVGGGMKKPRRHERRAVGNGRVRKAEASGAWLLRGGVEAGRVGFQIRLQRLEAEIDFRDLFRVQLQL